MSETKFNDRYLCLRDSREQENHGWVFDRRIKGCDGMEVTGLKTADYTIKGLEDILMIERKADVKEYASNVFQQRFRNELERMKGVPFAYVILEFPFRDIIDYPRVACIPHCVRKKIRVGGSTLLKVHLELEQQYPWVRFHFAGGSGREMAISLFKRAVEYGAKIGRFPTIVQTNNKVNTDNG